jgi:hypothetical protein
MTVRADIMIGLVALVHAGRLCGNALLEQAFEAGDDRCERSTGRGDRVPQSWRE